MGCAALLAAFAFALLLPQPANAQTPTVSSVSVSDITDSAAKATVTIANPASGTLTVYLRIRVRNTIEWRELDETQASGSPVEIDIQQTRPDTSYEVEASLDHTFLTRVARTTFSSLRTSIVLASLDVKDIEQTGAVVSITFNRSGATAYVVYARIRRAGAAEWDSILIPPGFLNTNEQTVVNQAVEDLMPATEYVLHVSTDGSFRGGQNKYVRFRTLPPAVESIFSPHPSQTQFSFVASLPASDFVRLPVYFRYRIVGSRQWLYAENDSYEFNGGTDLVTGWLYGLTSGRDHELEASTDPGFPSDRTQTAVFTTRPPGIRRVEADALTQTKATVTVTISAPNGDRQTVNARYREVGEPDWTDLPSRATTSDTATWRLEGLTSDTEHEVQASFDDAFPQASTVSGEFATAPPSIATVTVDHSTVTPRAAEVAVTIAEPNGNTQIVNVQYRTAFERTWTNGGLAQSDAESATAPLGGLLPKTAYQVRVSLDPTFPEDATRTTSFTTDPLPPSVASVYVKSVGTNVVDIVTTVDDPSSSVPVLLRYRETSSQQWSSTITGSRGRDRWERRITNLSTGVEHEVQVSTDSAFASQSTQSVTFSTLQASPTLSSLTVGGVTMTEATATVRIASPSGTETVYLRYREAPSGPWSSRQTDTTDTGEVTFTLSGLTAGRNHQAQASQNAAFPDTDTLIAAFTTQQPMPEIQSVTVDSATRTTVAGTVVFDNPGTEQNYVTIGAQSPGGQRWLIGVQFTSDSNTALWEFSRIGGAALISDTEYSLYAIAGRNNYTGELLTEDLHGTFTTLPPAVTAVDVRDVGHTSATLRLAIGDPNGRSYPVSVRYRAVGETQWTEVLDVATDASSVTVELAALTSGALFEVQASIDSAYAEELTAIATVVTLPYKPSHIELFLAGPREVQLTVHLLRYNSAVGPQLRTYVRYRRASPQGPWYSLEPFPPFPGLGGGSFFYHIRGLDPDTVYEVQASSDDRLARDLTESFRFSTSRPAIATIDVVNETFSEATLNLLLQDTDGKNRTVYIRYRPGNSDPPRQFTTARASTSTDTATITLTNLRAGVLYEVVASTYSDFPLLSLTLALVSTEDARIEGFKLKEVGQAEAVLDVNLAGHGLYVVPVYYRFRPIPSGVWGPTYVEHATTRGAISRVEGRLPLLTSDAEYEVQVSSNVNFVAADTLSLTFTTLPPSLVALTPSVLRSNSADLTVTIAAPNGTPQTVYLQYHRRGEGTWIDLPIIVTSTATGAHSLTGLLSRTTYDLRASLSEDFPSGETATASVVMPLARFSTVQVSDVTQTEVEFTITFGGPIGGAQQVLVEIYPVDDRRNVVARASFIIDSLTSTVRVSRLKPGTSYRAYVSNRSNGGGVPFLTPTFDTLPPDPALSLLYADTITAGAAQVTAVVSDLFSRTPTVNLRHRATGEADWEPTTSRPATNEVVVFPLSGLAPGVRHDVQTSLDPDFPSGETTSTSFTTLQSSPSLSSLTIGNIMQSTAEATVLIASHSGSEQVYLRYRQLPSGRWSRTLPASTDTGTAEFAVTGLAPGARYSVEASQSSSFPATDTRIVVIATPPPSPTIARLVLYVRSGYDISFDAYFANGGAGVKTVYVRHRVSGAREWDPRVFTETTTSEKSIRLQPDGLQSDTPYDFQVSLDDQFPRGATASITSRTAGARMNGAQLGTPGTNTIDVTATVRFASSEDQPVYTRYRTLPSGRWVSAPIVTVDNPTNSEEVMVDYTVTGLLAGTDYEIEVDAVPDFSRRHIRTFTTQPPTASGVHIHQKSQREVQVKVSTKDINDGVTVYTRYRSGSSQWLHRRPVDARSGHVFQFPLGGLAFDHDYELQASFDSDFPQAETRSTTFKTLWLSLTCESLQAVSVTRESAMARVKVYSRDGDEQTVHLRWRELGESAWTTMAPQTTIALTGTFELNGLQEDTLYEMEAALDSNFDAATTLSQVFDTRGGSTTSTRTTTGGGGGGGFGPAPIAPKFADGFRATREVAENAGPGNAVGVPVPATHPDDLEITYSLSGTDAASFTVDEETGQIQVKEGVELKLGQTLTLNLTATDSAGFGAIIIVAIEVVEAMHHRYDANRNGNIERDEVIAAVKDYFDGEIDKDEVIDLIKLYFAESG